MPKDLTYPRNEDRLASHITLDVIDGQLNNVGPQFKLPLPQGLSIGDAATYENADLGLKGSAISGAHGGSGAVDALEKMEAEEKAAETAAADELDGKTPAPNKKATAGKVVDDLISRFGGNLGRLAVGVSPNPNTRAVFRQVNLRSFQLAFKMIPEDTGEAQNIKDIVEEFRTQLYPEAQGYGEGEEFVTAFKFPNLFHMRVHLGGSVVKELEFLPAYLTAMSTTYNGSTNAILAKDGGSFSFFETDINLTFMEYRALFKRRGGGVEYDKIK